MPNFKFTLHNELSGASGVQHVHVFALSLAEAAEKMAAVLPEPGSKYNAFVHSGEKDGLTIDEFRGLVAAHNDQHHSGSEAARVQDSENYTGKLFGDLRRFLDRELGPQATLKLSPDDDHGDDEVIARRNAKRKLRAVRA